MTGFSLFLILFQCYLTFAICYRWYYPPDTVFGDGSADDTEALQFRLDNLKDGELLDCSKLGMCGKFRLSKTLKFPGAKGVSIINGNFRFKPRVDTAFLLHSDKSTTLENISFSMEV